MSFHQMLLCCLMRNSILTRTNSTDTDSIDLDSRLAKRKTSDLWPQIQSISNLAMEGIPGKSYLLILVTSAKETAKFLSRLQSGSVHGCR
jgi:hypothetical protein